MSPAADKPSLVIAALTTPSLRFSFEQSGKKWKVPGGATAVGVSL
jgi:hypothetical protein